MDDGLEPVDSDGQEEEDGVGGDGAVGEEEE